MIKVRLKQLLYVIVCAVFIISCNAYKSARKTLLNGNYDKVISLMTNKYKKGVKEKYKRELIMLLHEAYVKANARDLEMIDRHKQSADLGRYKHIYESYSGIQNRQDKIKPFLPLTLNGKEVEFEIVDYSKETEVYKEIYAKELNSEALSLLDNPTKPNAQKAYGLLTTLQSLYPKYAGLSQNMHLAYTKGTTFIYVAFRNQSEYLMPKVVDETLRSLDKKYLNRNWKVFHTFLNNGTQYDYDVLFDIQDIFVSPEVISRKQFVSEKEIIDGWEYQKDGEGNFVLDSLNNKIKVDVKKTIRAEVNELHYDKNAVMKTKVAVINNLTNRIEATRSFESNRFFSDFSCEITGDEKALDTDYRKTIKYKINPFPTDTEILLDCTQEIKQQVKSYLKSRF